MNKNIIKITSLLLLLNLNLYGVVAFTPSSAKCGSADGKIYTSVPTNNELCNKGLASSINETDTSYDWSCKHKNSQAFVECSATKLVDAPKCGTANNKIYDKPKCNFFIPMLCIFQTLVQSFFDRLSSTEKCEIGTATNYKESSMPGIYTWDCETTNAKTSCLLEIKDTSTTTIDTTNTTNDIVPPSDFDGSIQVKRGEELITCGTILNSINSDNSNKTFDEYTLSDWIAWDGTNETSKEDAKGNGGLKSGAVMFIDSDKIYVDETISASGTINLGLSDDVLKIASGTDLKSNVDMGIGDDLLIFSDVGALGKWSNSKNQNLLDGGSGTDILVLNDMALSDYNLIKNNIKNFEEIILSDGKIINDTFIPNPIVVNEDFLYSEPLIQNSQDGNTTIYQSTFVIGDVTNSWNGKIIKSDIDLVNGVLIEKWNTNTTLNNPNNRKIFTIGNGLNFDLNNFNTNNKNTLFPFIFPNLNVTISEKETLMTNFINWYRGVDIIDEDKDTNRIENRSLLGDVYNANLEIITKPNEFVTIDSNRYESNYRYINDYKNFRDSDTQKNRTKILVAASNDGMIHAFNDETGEEMWSFIPPFNLEKIGKMINIDLTSDIKIKDHIVNSTFTMDGKIFYKDVYVSGTWKTLLFASAGRGSNAITVLDVTDTTNPKHYFSVENDKDNSIIKYWEANGNLITYTNTNYQTNLYNNLGKIYNKPVIALLPTNVPTGDISTSYDWFMVFGAGKSGGSGIFVVNLENPLNSSNNKFIDFSAQDIANNDISLNFISELSGISAETTKELYGINGIIFYFADNEGTLWRMNATNKADWLNTNNYNKILTVDSNLTNERMNYTKVIPYVETNPYNLKKELYLSYGQGNIDKVNIYNINSKNLIINIKDKGFPYYNESSYSEQNKLNYTDFNNLNFNYIKTLNNLVSLSPSSTSDSASANDLGWYVNLNPSERIFSDILVSDHVVYASSFIPNEPNELTSCGAGTSYLYAINSITGIGLFAENEKRINTGTKITNLTSTKNSLILTLEKNIDVSNSLTNTGLVQINNLIIGQKQGLNVTKPVNIINKKEVK